MNPTGLCTLPLQTKQDRTAPCCYRTNLGSARPTLLRARSVSCSLLNQQAFCLEPQLEVDDGFHRTPFVPGCSASRGYAAPDRLENRAWPA